jgi:hypothetical protein
MAAANDPSDPRVARPTPMALVIAAWLVVGLPLVWGVLQTLKKAVALFQ